MAERHPRIRRCPERTVGFTGFCGFRCLYRYSDCIMYGFFWGLYRWVELICTQVKQSKTYTARTKTTSAHVHMCVCVYIYIYICTCICACLCIYAPYISKQVYHRPNTSPTKTKHTAKHALLHLTPIANPKS